MELKLKNKTALILSSSKGIGLGIAKALCEESCDVIITSSNKKNIEIAKSEIFKETNKKISSYVMNLEKINSVNKTINKIIRDKKKIDILIINSPGPLPLEIEKLNIQDLKKSLNVNLINLIVVAKKIIPIMKKNKFGRIINLASTTGKEPDNGMVLSNITRSGMLAFSKTASKELSKFGITFNSILTGGVMTDRTISLIENKARKTNKSFKSILNNAAKNVPVGFISSPKQFAHFIVFLSSPLSIYINGASIPVDGGVMKSI
tara:strand:+ start:820 stop:1608 length:789 start_codon:yes stop_codon:yes gene_type:complete